MKQPIRGWASQLDDKARLENLRRTFENHEEKTAVITINVFPEGAIALYCLADDIYTTSVHLVEGQEASEERAVKNLVNRLYREIGREAGNDEKVLD